MFFITADQLVAHAVGDYVLQSQWMATEKTKRSVAALAHVATYVLPFLFLTRSPAALLFIAGTHFVIDRWRLARFVVWAKNCMAPQRPYHSSPAGQEVRRENFATGIMYVQIRRNWRWRDCTATGYGPDVPEWLAVWLLIIADNVLHVICNAVALRWLA